MYGLGLAVLDPEDFRVSEVISSASIQFSDKAFLVDVRVIHISPHDGGYVDWMTRVIAEMKAAMLTLKDVFK